MAKNILELVIKLTKEGGGDTQTVKSLVDIKSGFSQVAVVAGAVGAAVAVVDKVLDATVGKFTSYATKVSVFSSALNTTSEEGSKLIQVADDFGISADAMQAAMFRAVKNGIEPTIDGLARAADHYNSLSTAEDKANYLQTTFGKSSQELARLLSTGSEAIREQTDNLGSLLLTQQDLNAARALEIAQNELLDEQEKMQITTGKQLLPVQLSITQNLVAQATAWEDMGKASGKAMDPALANAIRAYRSEVEQLANAEGTMVRIGNDFVSVLENSSGTMTRLGNNFVTNSAASLDMATNFKDILEVSKELKDVEEKRTDLNTKLAEAVRLYGENSKQAKDLRGEIEALDKSSQAWTNQFIFGLLQAQLAADGVLSEEDIQKLLVYGQRLGVVSENAASTYQNLLDMTDAILGIPKKTDVEINVRVNQTGNGTLPPGYYVTPSGLVQNGPSASYANGGTLDRDKIAVVGDRPGTGWGPDAEVIIGDRVIPHDQAQLLKDMGLLDGVPAYATGTFGPYIPPKPHKGQRTNPRKYSHSGQRTVTVSPTHSGNSTGGDTNRYDNAQTSTAPVDTAAVTTIAAEAVTPVVTESVRAFKNSQETSTRENTAQVARQTAAVLASGEAQLAALQRIADAIEAQAEQLAAELQKGR